MTSMLVIPKVYDIKTMVFLQEYHSKLSVTIKKPAKLITGLPQKYNKRTTGLLQESQVLLQKYDSRNITDILHTVQQKCCGKASQKTTQYHIQWGKKVFSQPPIVQVLPLKKMREACNFHHRYTSTMRDKISKKIQKITL